MDDMKVYTRGRRTLKGALSQVNRVSEAVGMELGCESTQWHRSKRSGAMPLPGDRSISEERETTPYQYLGIEQVLGPSLKTVKDRLKKNYLGMLSKIWASELNSKHVQATGCHNSTSK